MIGLLDLVDDLFFFQGLQLGELLFLLLLLLFFALFLPLASLLPGAIFATHSFFLVCISGMGDDGASVRVLKAEVVVGLIPIHLIATLLVFAIDGLLVFVLIELWERD